MTNSCPQAPDPARASRVAWCAAAALAALLGLAGPAGAATLPDNQRLDPVRPALEQTLDQAARDGLPAELIVTKVREGLAKGVSPQAIRAAAERLARSLGDADRFLRAHRKTASSPALVRAVAEARTSGVDLEVATPVVTSDAAEPTVVRAVEVLTDLALRGYPTGRAALVVKEVAERDPTSVARLVAGLESIRVNQTVSRVDALETLGRNIASTGGSFESALDRSLDGSDHGNNGGTNRGQGSDHMSGTAAAKKAMGNKK